jgi:hypothetical protein
MEIEEKKLKQNIPQTRRDVFLKLQTVLHKHETREAKKYKQIFVVMTKGLNLKYFKTTDFKSLNNVLVGQAFFFN